MSCKGCYRKDVEGYCLRCRKLLFGGKRVSDIFPFKSPEGSSVAGYREQVKRLSISGVQLKYSLTLTNNILGFTDAAGQYILKPIPPAHLANVAQAPENEHLTMQIARQVFKIETAANALIYFEDGQPAYLTKRFDVKADGGKYMQEDFAQLGGRAKHTHGDNYKYHGTYEDMGLLVKKYVVAYMPVIEVFFKTVLFNYLFSNGDAHTKNFSLIQSDAGDYRLTPAYDLMCTILHTPNEQDTALDLFDGDINTPYYQQYGHYGYPHFMELAQRIGIIEARAKRIVADMLSKNDLVAQMITQSFLSEETKGKYLSYYLDKVRRF